MSCVWRTGLDRYPLIVLSEIRIPSSSVFIEDKIKMGDAGANIILAYPAG